MTDEELTAMTNAELDAAIEASRMGRDATEHEAWWRENATLFRLTTEKTHRLDGLWKASGGTSGSSIGHVHPTILEAEK